ncbi:MAG: hypothetical protein ACD_7C00184G0001 [uncultured bacterium]|nr:MAG: hypothetical protein ACD_7C00184G0001 [uncultured bacterium]
MRKLSREWFFIFKIKSQVFTKFFKVIDLGYVGGCSSDAFKINLGDLNMNMHISNFDYFPIQCFSAKAKELTIIYGALFFCQGKSIVPEKVREIDGYTKEFLTDSDQWIIDLRFCAEKYDFLVRLPWRWNEITDPSLKLGEDVLILRTENSDEIACGLIVQELVEIFWEEFCRLPDRERNKGPIPNKIFSPDGKIPEKYLQTAAFFHSLKNAGDSLSNWFLMKEWFIAQGFQFAQ